MDAAFSFFQNVNFGGYYAGPTRDGHERRRRELPGAVRLRGRPLRRAAAVPRRSARTSSRRSASCAVATSTDRTRRHASARGRARIASASASSPTRAARVPSRTRPASSRPATDRALRRRAAEQRHVHRRRWTTSYELLVRPFTVAPGVRIPTGGYDFTDVTVSYQMGQQRRVSRNAGRSRRAQFYNGTINGATGTRPLAYAILKQWSVEPSVTINDVELPAGDFTTKLIRARTDYGFSPRMFVSALVQSSSSGPHLQQQLPLPLGVSARQRTVRRLHRRARHRRAGLSGPEEPRVRREGEPPGPILMLHLRAGD